MLRAAKVPRHLSRHFCTAKKSPDGSLDTSARRRIPEEPFLDIAAPCNSPEDAQLVNSAPCKGPEEDFLDTFARCESPQKSSGGSCRLDMMPRNFPEVYVDTT